MLQLKLRAACQDTTAHSLPRLVTGKPVFIRVVWLLLFLFFLCLFLRGLVGFVVKLQSRQVTSSLQAGEVRFQFPDVYACFENAVSGTYSVNMNDSTIEQLNTKINDTSSIMEYYALKSNPASELSSINNFRELYSYFYPPSLPFRLLADSLARRPEQTVLSSVTYEYQTSGNSTQQEARVPYDSFYHPTFLRCFRWSQATSSTLKTLQRRSLTISLFTDAYDGRSIPSLNGKSIESPVYLKEDSFNYKVPVGDWTLLPNDLAKPDRNSGVRIFLMPPGEYPSEFGTSFLLSPGQHFLIELSMREELHNPDQFNCVNDVQQVQFVNPYDSTPYNHEYSYSYCYFTELNRAAVSWINNTIAGTPIPWSLKDTNNCVNMSSTPNFLETLVKVLTDPSFGASLSKMELDSVATSACKSRERCSRLVYDARISSASWPTTASLEGFLGTTVATARDKAVSKGLSVPGLDYLVNASSGNSSVPAAAVAFARANLLKLEIRPSRMDCDRLKFSIDYGFENFVADIGGIMGIYLGMSLLTICELFDLIAELLYLRECSGRSKNSVNVSR